MITISIKDAETQFATLAERVEQGETIIVTREDHPIFDLVPHRPRGGLNLEAGDAYVRQRGYETVFRTVSEDFDDPLPEARLVQPLP